MKVIIIGNGAAGNSAASIIRGKDKHAKLTIVSEEKEQYYASCALTRYISGEIERKDLFLRTPGASLHSRIELLLGHKVEKINLQNREVILENNELEYDRLILATGSQPTIPEISGIKKAGVIPLKTIGDAERILHYGSKDVVIIGAGPIGVGVAVALTKRGFKVHLVEIVDRILPKLLDEQPSSVVRRILEKNGINVLTNETVTQVLGKDKVEGVETTNTELKCGAVILAVGMKPRIDPINPNRIKTGQLGGITTGNRMETSAEDVYACGDCVESTNLVTGKTTLNLLWPNAIQQGRVAGSNSLGIDKEYPGSVNINTIEVFGTHVASIGCNQTEIDPAGEYEVLEKKYGDQYHSLIVADGRIVGAQSIGRLEHMGVLLKAVRKYTSIEDLKKMGYEREYFLKNPWYTRFSVYL